MADEHGAPRRPVVLIILDGWGIGVDEPTNAVLVADTPCLDRLQATCPSTRLRCSGRDVGLPDGIMGNSEVGHLNIGAGRPVLQDLPRIDAEIAELAGILNDVAATLKPLGMLTGYHAHPFDFVKFGDETAWEILFSSTSQDVVMQMDIGNCAGGGGARLVGRPEAVPARSAGPPRPGRPNQTEWGTTHPLRRPAQRPRFRSNTPAATSV